MWLLETMTPAEMNTSKFGTKDHLHWWSLLMVSPGLGGNPLGAYRRRRIRSNPRNDFPWYPRLRSSNMVWGEPVLGVNPIVLSTFYNDTLLYNTIYIYIYICIYNNCIIHVHCLWVFLTAKRSHSQEMLHVFYTVDECHLHRPWFSWGNYPVFVARISVAASPELTGHNSYTSEVVNNSGYSVS